MIKTLYEHFTVLYQQIQDIAPHLASEHTLKQEQEIYDEATKFTYRNVSFGGFCYGELRLMSLPSVLSIRLSSSSGVNGLTLSPIRPSARMAR
jgi:RNA exonuclease 1